MFRKLRDKAKNTIEKISVVLETLADATGEFLDDFDCDFD